MVISFFFLRKQSDTVSAQVPAFGESVTMKNVIIEKCEQYQ